TKPIRVANANAILSFDEVALVEPGEPGAPWPDPFFYDYVVVEGSKDGCTWTAFQDGWDARAYPEWETAYANNTPSPALFRRRNINMLNAFDVDDTLLVRFRLFADAGANGWGWIIDNLDIQSAAQSGVGDGPSAAVLSLTPGTNPFRDRTTLAYTLPTSGRVALNIFDVSGRLVRQLVDEVKPAGQYEVTWDGSTAGGDRAANGMYFVQLVGADQVVKKKVTLLR
ncbi:MAG TPA: FlgD immunoglobulin-like domain containing protein, partial [Candidatus Eisenbacteria bacterium]